MSLQPKNVNISPSKRKQHSKLGFTIYQDKSPKKRRSSPSNLNSKSRGYPYTDNNHQDLDKEDVESSDKENDVFKENLQPSSSADILNGDNLLNQNLIGTSENNHDDQKKRIPLSSKSIFLYPGILEVYDESALASNISSNNNHDLKQRVLHLPRKSSPLKPVSLQDYEQTPSKNSGKLKPSIFSSPSASPQKSKLTNKLLSLSTVNMNNSSSESISSGSPIKNKSSSILSIPNLSSFSSDSLIQKQPVFRDSPMKKSRRSSTNSVYSDYTDSGLISPSNSSNNNLQSIDDFRRIRRLTSLWKTKSEDSSTKVEKIKTPIRKKLNSKILLKLPEYITPPRTIDKNLLNELMDLKDFEFKLNFKNKSFVNLEDSKIEDISNKQLKEILNETSSTKESFINENVNDIGFGKGIDDGYDENNDEKVKIDMDQLEFTIYKDE